MAAHNRAAAVITQEIANEKEREKEAEHREAKHPVPAARFQRPLLLIVGAAA
jgi:hypothetical protein